MSETQKVWTDKEAKFWIYCFDIFIIGWFLVVVAGIYFLMGEHSREHQIHDFVYFNTLAAMFGFLLFAMATQLSWPATRVLSAEQISDLYAKVSVCPVQLEIIQNAVKNNLTLRKRDLEFANWLYQMHQASISQQVEDEKRQKVLQGIKHDCLTPELKIPD